MDFPTNVPNAYLVVNDVRDNRGMRRTPYRASNACHRCREHYQRFCDPFGPDSRAPIGAAGQKDFRTERGELHRVYRPVVRHETLYMLVKIIRRALVDATLVRADEVDGARGRMSTEHQHPWISIYRRLVNLTMRRSVHSRQGTLYPVDLHNLRRYKVFRVSIAEYMTFLIAGVNLFLIVVLLVTEPPLNLPLWRPADRREPFALPYHVHVSGAHVDHLHLTIVEANGEQIRTIATPVEGRHLTIEKIPMTR